MRILSITAGPAGMYCGSCIRDNALAAAMIRQGHDVMLLPLYTPTRPDEANVSAPRVFFGGISVYLEQIAPWFRHAPRWLDRLLDSKFALKLAARGSVSNQATDLAPLTISMLRGEDGNQAKEFAKLLEWLVTEPPPDVIILSYTLLIALAAPLRRALKCPVVCSLQGEDLFLDGLGDAKHEAIELIREQSANVSAFLATSRYYADYMTGYLGVPAEKMYVAPVGITLDGYQPAVVHRDVFNIGYFARVAHEKGLHHLAEAYRILKHDSGLAGSRLLVGGYLGPESRAYFADIQARMKSWGLENEFHYAGELTREAKLHFLAQLDVFSMPSVYREPKGLSVLEAMASGVPAVLPRHGAFPDIIETTGGGILCNPDDPRDLAQAILSIYHDPVRRARLGQSAAEGVRAHYSADRSAARTVEILMEVCGAK